MSALRLTSSLRVASRQVQAATLRRGYAAAADDKLKLSLVLPHQVGIFGGVGGFAEQVEVCDGAEVLAEGFAEAQCACAARARSPRSTADGKEKRGEEKSRVQRAQEALRRTGERVRTHLTPGPLLGDRRDPGQHPRRDR
jgi:hypothetical protein